MMVDGRDSEAFKKLLDGSMITHPPPYEPKYWDGTYLRRRKFGKPRLVERRAVIDFAPLDSPDIFILAPAYRPRHRGTSAWEHRRRRHWLYLVIVGLVLLGLVLAV